MVRVPARLRLAPGASLRLSWTGTPLLPVAQVPPMHINDLLKTAVSAGASDLHLKVGAYPMMRVNGTLVVASEEKRLDRADTEGIAGGMFSREQAEKFRANAELDLAYSVPGLGRFRCNVFQQRGTVGLVLRIIPYKIKSIDELGLPPVLKKIAAEERGLVLVTGTTGSGKSTTLAAMIDYINSTRSAHIMTVEDPIEYLHRDHLSLVNQREIMVDTMSFAAALRSALRQDPDVILVGEMRDHETVETALLAAETGHLVFSTLHTLDATETVNRIIAVFPPHQQRQVRIQLASVLKAAISQRLMPRADGMGRAPAVEVMVSTAFIRDCIVDKDKTSLIHGAIAAGTSQYGMQTFDQSIFSLYQQRLVTLEEALRWASNKDEFKMKVQGISTSVELAREEMARAANPADKGKPAFNPDIVRFGS
jgi:twitching motility protein PilT